MYNWRNTYVTIAGMITCLMCMHSIAKADYWLFWPDSEAEVEPHTPNLPDNVIFDIAFHPTYIDDGIVLNRMETPADGESQTAYNWEIGYLAGSEDSARCDVPSQGFDDIGYHLNFTSSGYGACLRLASGTNPTFIEQIPSETAGPYWMVAFSETNLANYGSRMYFETRDAPTVGAGIAHVITGDDIWMITGNGTDALSTYTGDFHYTSSRNVFSWIRYSSSLYGHSIANTVEFVEGTHPGGSPTSGSVAKIGGSDDWNTTNFFKDGEKLYRMTFSSGTINITDYLHIMRDYEDEYNQDLLGLLFGTTVGTTASGLQVTLPTNNNDFVTIGDVAIEDCDGIDLLPSLSHYTSDPTSYGDIGSGEYASDAEEDMDTLTWHTNAWEHFTNWPQSAPVRSNNDLSPVTLYFNFGAEKEICRFRISIASTDSLQTAAVTGAIFKDASDNLLTFLEAPEDGDDFIHFITPNRNFYEWYIAPTKESTLFTALTDQTESSLVTSNIAQITGLASSSTITITGNNGEYRICADSLCNTENHTWTATAGSIDNNEYLQLRQSTSASLSTTLTTTASILDIDYPWSVTTRDLDTTPDSFDFTDLTDQDTSTLVTSNIVQVTGIDSAAVTIAGTGTPSYRICSNDDCTTEAHTWGTSEGTIEDDEYLQLRLTTSDTAAAAHTATVDVGTLEVDWSATTAGEAATDPAMVSWAFTGTAATLNDTTHKRIARYDDDSAAVIDNSSLGMYDWGGSSWSLNGSAVATGANATSGICQVNSNTFAIIDSDSDAIETAIWTGSAWDLASGSDTSITAFGTYGDCDYLEDNVIVVKTDTNMSYVTYTSGSGYTVVGSPLDAGDQSTRVTVTGISATRIATQDTNPASDEIKFYDWGGSSWVQVGNTLATGINGIGYYDICAVSGTQLAALTGNDSLQGYVFDGTDVTTQGSALSDTANVWHSWPRVCTKLSDTLFVTAAFGEPELQAITLTLDE